MRTMIRMGSDQPHATMTKTETITAETAAEAAEQKDNKDDDENKPKRDD